MLLLYSRNLNNKCEKLNCVWFHDKPFKIGQPPSSLSIMERTLSTPADSIADSLTQESYKWRAFKTAWIRVVSFGSGDVKISNQRK
jgi:hypothetical protein